MRSLYYLSNLISAFELTDFYEMLYERYACGSLLNLVLLKFLQSAIKMLRTHMCEVGAKLATQPRASK
jgi:hypothetical protein